jgi:hypothetical protein
MPDHEVPVRHTLKDFRLIKNYVNGALEPRTMDPPKKGGAPPDNDDVVGAMYPGEDGVVHMIFGGGARSSYSEKSSTQTPRSHPT